MLEPTIPMDEEERLATLHGLNILDTPPEERFDRLTRIAQHILDVPIVIISLVDSNRQWFKSCLGLDATEMPLSISFCGDTILSNEALVIPDAALDPRFADNPLVAGAPHIRFYAGQPLKANNGSRLGALCIMDKKPRQPSQADLDILRDLAALVENELNLLDTVEIQDALLHASEERFRTLAIAAFKIVWTTNAQGEVTGDIPAWQEFTGQSRGEIKGWGWINALHPDDVERTVAIWRQAVATHAIYETEYRIRRHDGVCRHFSVRGVPVYEQDGSIREWVGTCSDITESLNTQQTLQFVSQRGWTSTGEAFIPLMADYLAKMLGVDFVFVGKLLDKETVATTTVYVKGEIVSNFQYSLSGTPCENVVGQTICVYPQNIQRLFPCDQLLVDMGVEGYASIPLWDSNGNALGLLAVMHSSILEDVEMIRSQLQLVSTRVAAELERNESEKSLRLTQFVVDRSSIEVYRTDPEGRILYANQQACQALGYSLDEMLTLSIHDIDSVVRPESGPAYWQDLRKNQAVFIETFHRCKDGSIRSVEVSANYVKYDDQEYSFAFVRDITERKRSDEERGQLANILEQSLNEIHLFDAKTLLFTYANKGARRNLGYSLEQLLTMTAVDIKPEFDETLFRDVIAPLLKNNSESLTFETIYCRADNTTYPVEVHLHLTTMQERTVFLAIALDITERKQAEARALRLTHLFQALSEINQAIVRMEQQDELFPLVCRCAVECGGMRMAWIGQLDKASGLIRHATSYGIGMDYLDGLNISSHADVPEGRGPIGTALRESRSVIVNNYFADPMTVPWRERVANNGWNSQAVFPIQRGGLPFAVLSVFHTQINAFDDEAIALLQEMSTDVAFALDNFDREAQRKASTESLLLAASVYEASGEAMLVTDAENRILSINPAFTKITGYTSDEVLGKNPDILSSSHHSGDFYQVMWQEVNTTGHWQGEVWDQRKDGSIYPKLLTMSTIYREDGSAYRRVALFTDISKVKESEELIWRQANFDALTGLPNRRMYHDRLEHEIKKAQRADLVLAVLLLDLDHFKEVNDTMGHHMGDILLKEVAQRLSTCVREADTVARLGGDEFTIILGELSDLKSIDRVAQDILCKLSEPFHLGNEIAFVSASIGITLYPEDATEISELTKNADQAMYAAKALGRNRYSYFTPSMQQAAQTRMQCVNDLRGALAGQQFWIAYQPIVELATGAIHKAEALLRWQHPTRGLVSPAEFIPIAEDTGLIIDIGDWVFREAVQQVKRWRTTYHPQFQISINKSPVQFHNASPTHFAWYDHLQQVGLPGQSITVEITEGLLLNSSTLVTKRLLEFQGAGMQVSLDDFGTGYSSLSYLKKFGIDYLKIDQSFTQNLGPDSDDLALCEAIIVMSHKLGIKVIAEGVETEEQKFLLTAAGCDYAQGYLFSKPVPAAAFEKLLDGITSD